MFAIIQNAYLDICSKSMQTNDTQTYTILVPNLVSIVNPRSHVNFLPMKKSFSFAIFLVFLLSCYNSYAQNIPVYPIPSYNVSVNGYANFKNNLQSLKNPVRAKQELDIQIRSGSGTHNCTATVWVYSLDQTTVLGPYTVTCGQTLSVPIDERQWGVLVESEEEVIVDVWIVTGDNSPIQGGNNKKQESNRSESGAIFELGTSSENES